MQDFYVQNGLFDRKHLLRLQPETIEFEANDSIDNLFIQCRKVEVKAFKYYDERLQFDMFRVGTKFKISIQKQDNTEFNVIFKGYFGKQKQVFNVYNEIKNLLWNYYFYDVYLEKIELLNRQVEFEIPPLKFTATGIEFISKNQKKTINFENLSLKKYYTYFASFSKTNSDNYLLIDFKSNWNSAVSYKILKTITNHINPQQ
jgi:hypothetical protein